MANFRIGFWSGALAALSMLGAGCGSADLRICGSAEVEGGEPALELRSQRLAGQENTYFYLRCNATGWTISANNQLAPLGDGRLLSLSFEVTEPWMMQNGDGCNITETRVEGGWSSTTYSWTTSNSGALSAPGTEPMQVGSQHFTVHYPETGTYRAVFDRSSGSLTIAPPGTLVHPISASYAQDWMNGGHIDLDPSSGVRDYAGFSRAYDGHTGVDFGIGSFRAMEGRRGSSRDGPHC